jgi:tetratricopeptide (TPR) repeat protein
VRSLLTIATLLLAVACSAPAGPGKVLAPGPGAAAFLASLDAFEAGDYSAALQQVDAALVLEQHAQYHTVRAAMLLFSRRFDEARALLEGLRQDPLVAVGAQVGLGHLAINARSYEEAHGLLSGGLATAPAALPLDAGVTQRYADFVYELACLGMGWSAANRNEHVRAISWFDRILARQSDDLLGMIGKGNSLIGLGLLADATAMLESVLEAHPDNPYALAELAMIRLKNGEDGAAEEGFRKALAQDDRNYTCPYEGLGLLYLRQGRTEKAREHLQRAIQINPDIEYKKYNGLARIHMSEGNYEAATRLLRKSQDNFPHDGEALRLLGEIEGLRAGQAKD